MKILVCGGRDYKDFELIERMLFEYTNLGCNHLAIIQGGAKGADEGAALFCKNFGIPCLEILPNWDFYGKGAGIIRNMWMLDFGQPDLVIAFPGGKGTANMVEQARKRGIKVKEIT